MPWKKQNDLANDPSYLEPRITELENKETIVPTKTSELENDSGFLTTVTKSTIGLGSVQNYGIATQAEAEAGTTSSKYMTPQRTAQAISKLAPVPKASQIEITDTSNLFTINNVEGALSELFTNVSNGKELIATVITDKGVLTSGSDTFQVIADNISKLYLPPDDESDSPGSKFLIAGTKNAGYFGTVLSNDFITGDALATLVGLSSGTSQHSNTEWLKFAYNGQILFSPMKTIRNYLSWMSIYTANAVYGSKIITINGLQYKVRLWKGAENEPSYDTDSDRDAIGSEWNNLMLPIHINAPNNWSYPQYAGDTEDWGINFTDEDLLTHNSFGNGSYTLCQETTKSDSKRVARGGGGISLALSTNGNGAGVAFGWRPILELVQ